MATAARKFDGPFDLRRRILRDTALTSIERDVLEICWRAAAENRVLDSQEDIAEVMGFQSPSSAADVMRRLETKGYIRRQLYQRGRQVCIVATGQCTAPPSNTAPHWRLRTERVQAPAIQQVRSRMPEASVLIEHEARRLGKHMTDFLADLVYIGWHQYAAEKERGE